MSLRAGVAMNVVAAEHTGRQRLKLTFSDGHVSEIDFKSFLQDSLNPDTRQFLDEEKFKRFALRDGNLVWGDYELCFSMEDIYTGDIDHLSAPRQSSHPSQGKPYRQPPARRLAVAEARVRYPTRKTSRR